MRDAHERVKRILDLLGLELQIVVSLCMGAGNQNQFSERSASALSC